MQWPFAFFLLSGCEPLATIADFQRQLDVIAAGCELAHYHHRLEALSMTKAAINPLPNVRALPPPEHRVLCVRAELKKSRTQPCTATRTDPPQRSRVGFPP